MNIAALDLGTNTFLCLIVEVEKGEIKKVLADQTRVVRLGEGVHKTRRLSAGALQRAEECLQDFRQLMDDYRVEGVMAVATSAARDAQNGEKLFDLGRKYRIPIETITGEREAALSFHGIVSDRKDVRSLMGLDIGGGSTEVMRMGANDVVNGVSVDIGAVRLTEMFVTRHPTPPAEIKAIDDYAREKLHEFKNLHPAELVAAAGTPTTLAAIDLKTPFDAERIHGHKMTVERITELTQWLAKMSLPERKQVTGLDEGRADVIVAGALILRAACDIMNVKQVTVSVRGIRYGLAQAMARGEM